MEWYWCSECEANECSECVGGFNDAMESEDFAPQCPCCGSEDVAP